MDTSAWNSALDSARRGDLRESRQAFAELLKVSDASGRSRVLNNLAVLEAALGNLDRAEDLLEQVPDGDEPAGAVAGNRAFLSARRPVARPRGDRARPTRVAILSLLFNWPSTGGGTIHTRELADFLTRDGYEVRHLYAVHAGSRLGLVTEPLPYDAQPLPFRDPEWTGPTIRNRFREALDAFQPDWTIITDSWSGKVVLAEAAQGRPYFLRIAAMECLCPLNNVRLRIGEQGQARQCHRLQLADPAGCRSCVSVNGARMSGPLHDTDRRLAEFDNDDYAVRLLDVFRNAVGVLAVNPTVADLVRPFTPEVYVVPSGFDPARFRAERLEPPEPAGRKTRILFAGLTEEYMKGFSVLINAGAQLWGRRQDFEIRVTSETTGDERPFLRWIGWQSQQDLPAAIRACDVLVFPTRAQEALGRSAVEAMGCGRPVVASRLGGLPWVVEDGKTGLLCEPGDPVQLAACLERLLDDPPLRRRLGEAGRMKFERDFTWESVLDRHYRRLFGAARRARN